MQIVILLLFLIGINSVQAQSDLELVKSFGKAIEYAPSFAKNGNTSTKTMSLDYIWNRPNGVKETLFKYLNTGEKDKFDQMIIYNAQKSLSSFLIEAYDTNNKIWMRDIASLYLIPFKYLTDGSDLIAFPYPIMQDGSENARKELKVSRKFRLWVYEGGIKKKDGTYFKYENEISSSQFLYAVSVIIHYAIKNHLENEKVFKEFIEKYYPIAMNDHYLRWIFNRGIPTGSFTARGWKCNSGAFSHNKYIEHLTERRFGTIYFKNSGITPNPWVYCNAYQDKDGWIALGVAHLMAAHKLNQSVVPIDSRDYDELEKYLQKSLNLFNKRSKYEEYKTPDGKLVDIMVFDKGGMYGFADLNYSGYEEEKFPGWTTLDKNPAVPPSQKEVSWDMGHARRFVNFYWSFDKIINDLGLDFSNNREFPDLEDSRSAYANNLLYKAAKKFDSKQAFGRYNVYFTNYLCGNDGWYRVNYQKKPDASTSNSPSKFKGASGLSKSVLEGGQAYFIQYSNNKELLEPIKALYEGQRKKENPFGGDVYDEINSTASMPEDFFKSQKINLFPSPTSSLFR